MLRLAGSAEHSPCADLQALLNNFEHSFFLRIESTAAAVQRGVLVRVMNLHRDQKSLARIGERWKIPKSHRILRIEGSAEHSHCTCVYRPSRSSHEQFRTKGSAHRAY